MNRQRRLAVLALALAPMCATAPFAHAQTAAAPIAWPTKPVRFILPFPPGTGPDVVARIVGDKLARLWGQSVIIENRPGAGGMIAFNALKSARADEHLFTFVATSSVALSPYMYKSASVDIVRDLVPVAFVGDSPMVLAVRTESPFNSLADIVAQAKRQPDTLIASSPGQFSLPHLTTDLLSKASGTSIRAITYASTGDVVSAVISGDAQFMIDGISALEGFVKGKRLKLLATFGATRLPNQPAVPAVLESYPELVVNGWFGVLAINGTSAQTIERANRDINSVLAMPDVIERLEQLNIFPRSMTPAAFGTILAKERVRWEKALRDVGAQPITQ